MFQLLLHLHLRPRLLHPCLPLLHPYLQLLMLLSPKLKNLKAL
ncbi:MAG: hypothetical protein ACPHRF_03885 [Porticoccaceae bacterium]